MNVGTPHTHSHPRSRRRTVVRRAALATAVMIAATVAVWPAPPIAQATAPESPAVGAPHSRVRHKTIDIDGVPIFYREAGPPDAPAVLLLHGFPTSSHMFRNLIVDLSDRYRVIAPDYPGYGHSGMPPREEFEYSFDNLARVVDAFTQKVGLTRFVVYVQDYGAPIGYRIASAHPERIAGIVVQNGNAYDEGIDNPFWAPIKAYWADPTNREKREPLRDFLQLEGTKWQWTHGVREPELVAPENWTLDQALMDRPGNKDIQLDLLLSYGTNPPLYPAWQDYFRTHQPPMLIVWGKKDQIFPAEGAEPYKRDLKDLEFHLLDTGHFALEEDGVIIAAEMRDFLARVYAGR